MILALNPPNNVKELRHFLGMVQYYRDMWAKHSEMLAPFTYLVGECSKTKTTKKNKTKKKPWRWDLIHQQAFDKVKAAIAKEVVLAYPDFSNSFEIYKDTSSMQLKVVVAQDNRSIAFSSRILSKTQQIYSVTEIEHLAIVETLKEFKGMLWAQSIKVFTDHKKLTRDALGLTSDRYQWRLLLKEYAPRIIHIKGIHNTVMDAILRLEYNPKLNITNEYTHATLGVSSEEMCAQQWKSLMRLWQSYCESNASTKAHCIPINKVFANCSKEDKIYPLTTAEIAVAQQANATLKQLFKHNTVIIKVWRSNSLRILLVSAKIVG